MSVIERCHFVAYSFVFPALSSLSAMRCIVAARRPHSSTPTLQNTNNQEDPSIPPALCLVDPRVLTLSPFDSTRSLSPSPSVSLSPLLSSHRALTKQPALLSSHRRDVLYSSSGATVIRVSGSVALLRLAIERIAIAYIKTQSC